MQTTPGGPPAHPVHHASPEPAVEVHGRVVTTNQQAAACYREAQGAVDRDNAIVALRLAVAADAAFAVAVADLAAVTEALDAPPDSQQMSWERHHIEVVGSASTGDVNRAVDLLREHLASVGCDPLAFRIAAQIRYAMGNSDDLDDIAGRLPACHSTPWQCRP
jgi:hypothetical protein